MNSPRLLQLSASSQPSMRLRMSGLIHGVKVDDYACKILLGDGTGISIDQIFEIESPLFESSGMFGI